MAFPETSVLGAFFKSMVDLFQVSLVAISDAGLVFFNFLFCKALLLLRHRPHRLLPFALALAFPSLIEKQIWLTLTLTLTLTTKMKHET